MYTLLYVRRLSSPRYVHIVTELLHGLDLYEWIELKLGGNGRRGESPVIPERHALVLAGQVRATLYTIHYIIYMARYVGS